MEITRKCNDGMLHGLTPESFLGTSSQRYFSSNFKNVTHHIDETKIEKGNLYANVCIKWPPNWSEKKGVSLQPHIGTLDFFLIASRLAGAYFKTVRKISENQINEMWISEFHCKAGNKCIETNTNCCKCQLTSEISNSKTNQTEFILEVAIADSTVVLKNLLPDLLSDKKRQPDCEYDSYYTACYKDASRDITNIRICTRKKSIAADFELKHTNHCLCKGLGGIYMPCITFCDLVLVCGQLSQILLYELDNTTRENASNLWLRNIHCIYSKPIKEKTTVSVKVKESKIVNLRGSCYHCSDLTFNFNEGDLIAECSSAYQPFSK